VIQLDGESGSPVVISLTHPQYGEPR
jgi:hypothetical protein